MKKLLSLLTVLTISGTAIPTITAASPYQKTNNLENLNRVKRDLKYKEFNKYFSEIEKKDLVEKWFFDATRTLNFFTEKYEKYKVFSFNLEQNNPQDYDKINILSENETFTHLKWGGCQSTICNEQVNNYYGESIQDFLKKHDNNIKDILKNKKIDENDNESIKENAIHILQDIHDTFRFAGIYVKQKIGFTYYKNNNNYYLQVLLHQKLEHTTSGSGGIIEISLGNGIKLTKKEDDFNNKIENKINLDLKNKESKIEQLQKELKFNLEKNKIQEEIDNLILGKEELINYFNEIKNLNSEGICKKIINDFKRKGFNYLNVEIIDSILFILLCKL